MEDLRSSKLLQRPLVLEGNFGKALEQTLNTQATYHTVAQRCADWFILRCFRISATMAADIFCVLPTQIWDSPLPDKSKMQDRTDRDWFKIWMDSWFSRSRSTERMVRGKRNENAVLACFEKCDHVPCVQDVGLLQHKEHPFFAYSPDAMSFLSVHEDFRKLGWPPNASMLVNMHNKLLGYAVMATVAMKTNVSDLSLSERLLRCRSTEHLLYAGLGFAELSHLAEDYISSDHLRQCVYQCTVTTCDTFYMSVLPKLAYSIPLSFTWPSL